MRVPKLSLDHVQWHSLSCHLNGVRVTKLMRGEASTNAGLSREHAKALANGGACPG